MPRTLTHYELDYRNQPTDSERFTGPYKNLASYLPREYEIACRIQEQFQRAYPTCEFRLVACYQNIPDVDRSLNDYAGDGLDTRYEDDCKDRCGL